VDSINKSGARQIAGNGIARAYCNARRISPICPSTGASSSLTDAKSMLCFFSGATEPPQRKAKSEQKKRSASVLEGRAEPHESQCGYSGELDGICRPRIERGLRHGRSGTRLFVWFCFRVTENLLHSHRRLFFFKQKHTYTYTYMTTHTYIHFIFIITSKRLSQLDLKIYKVDH
jgi:hypothetical protein